MYSPQPLPGILLFYTNRFLLSQSFQIDQTQSNLHRHLTLYPLILVPIIQIRLLQDQVYTD